MYRFLMVFLVAALVCASCVPVRAADEPKWEKVFGCEFKNKADLKRWNLNDPVGEEPVADIQAYDKNAFHIHDGSVFIEARQQDLKGKHYTSGVMSTRGKLDTKFGKFEIRFRVPKGNGFQSQFSLVPLSSKSTAYVRILDVTGTDVRFGERTNSGSPNQMKIERDLSEDFHVISVVWLESSIVWSLDGKEIGRATYKVPDDKMYLVVNLAVNSGEDAQTHFPNALEVDYVRAYQVPSK